jgi:hypothetical protein
MQDNRVATARTMAMPVLSTFDRRTVRNVQTNRTLLIAAGLLLAVLIADVVLIALAAPRIAEFGPLPYTIT